MNCPIGKEPQGGPQALIPRVRLRTGEKVCDSSFFLSLLSLFLPRGGVFSLFARGLLIPFQLPLSPPLASPAGCDEEEEDDYAGDGGCDGKCQQEKSGERG